MRVTLAHSSVIRLMALQSPLTCKPNPPLSPSPLYIPSLSSSSEQIKETMPYTRFSALVLLLTALLLCSFTDAREPFACDPRNGVTRNLPFCRVSLPIQERARDLIGRLTLPEKIRLLVNNAIDVPRLGIKGYEWWSEALHGVSNVGPGTKFGGSFPGATSFPQVITTAASFNASLWEEIGRVLYHLLPSSLLF